MRLDLFEDPPIWTREDLYFEKERRLTEDLTALGPRPSWWRSRARGRYDRTVARLKKAHENHLDEMLATQDPARRALMAHLIGWLPPTEKR